MTDIDRSRREAPDLEPEEECRPVSRRRAISDAIIQAVEDDMEAREGVYRRLAAS